MRMTLSPCNNPRINAVDTADRGFKPQCHGMRKRGYMMFSPINIGVLTRLSVRTARCCAPNVMWFRGFAIVAFGCHLVSSRVAALRYTA